MRDLGFEHELQKVEKWLLAILRFAITREEDDRAAILAAAADMDRLGAAPVRPGFAFFGRTSTEICDLIVARHSPDNKAMLRRHLSKIQNDRLRRALEGALEIDGSAHRLGRGRGQANGDLWRGLPIRH